MSNRAPPLRSVALGLVALGLGLAGAPVLAQPGTTLFFNNLNGNLWDFTVVANGGDASLGNETASQGRSLRLRWGPVRVYTDSIAAAVPGAELSLWIRRGDDSFSEDPDAGEDLVIEYRDAGGNWVVIDTFAGDGTPGEIITPTYVLPPAALHANLSIQLRMTGGNGSDFDYWHVDDIRVTETTSTEPVYYSFEEDAWAGVPGEVLDGGSNGLNGTAVGGAVNDDTNPALPTRPGTCKYAELDGMNDYIEIADSPALDLASELTVAAWIYMRSFPSELHTIVSKDWNYEFHINSAGQVYWWWNDSTGTTRSITTPASINLNRWYHVAIVYESGSQTIYVDGVPWATASYSGTLRQNDLPLYIGTDWNFISRAFDGFIDEVYVIPSAYTQAEVQALRDATHDCPTAAAEFTINHDNFGINCLPEPITVDVIDSVAGTPLLNYNAQVQLDTQTGYGTWALVAGGGTLNDPVAGDGLATYDWPLGESQARFALTYPQGPPVVDVDVYQVTDPGIRDTDAEGALVFSPNGFTLSPVPIGNPPTIVPFDQPQTAADVVDVFVAAYGVTDDDPVCGVIETYDGSKTLSFWSTYLDPVAGTRNVAVDGVPIATSEAGSVGQPVAFSAGLAQVQVKYKDVGRIQILVKDDTVTDPADLPTGIRGGTSAFVSLPADFVLTDIRNGPGTVLNPQAVDANGPVFIPAGTDFRATVTAVDLDGDPTPNYGQETTPEDVRLDVSPAPTSPAIDVPAITYLTGFGAFGGGSATGFDFGWPEVGIIQLRPGIGDGDYLGAGDVTGALSENVGRFVPYDFELVYNVPEFGTACAPAGAMTPFTYMGQRFDYTLQPVITVTAKAYGTPAATTQNYTGAFFKLSEATLQNWAYTSAAGTLLGPVTMDATVLGANGIGTITFDGLPGGFAFQRDLIAPFDAGIDLSVDVVDADDVASSQNPARFDDIDFSDGDRIRYGRARFENAVGSELVDLAMPLVSEYFAGPGVGFVVNADDECASSVSLSLSGFTENLAPGETCVLDTGSPGASGAGCSAAAPIPLQFDEPPVGGDFNLSLAAPGAGNTGSVTVNATVPAWLKFDWDAGALGDEDPSGQATFGIYSGDDAQIYLREVY